MTTEDKFAAIERAVITLNNIGIDRGERVTVRIADEGHAALTAACDRERVYRKLFHAANNFYTMVVGECPSLLEDDHNAEKMEAALAECAKMGAKEQ